VSQELPFLEHVGAGGTLYKRIHFVERENTAGAQQGIEGGRIIGERW